MEPTWETADDQQPEWGQDQLCLVRALSASAELIEFCDSMYEAASASQRDVWSVTRAELGELIDTRLDHLMVRLPGPAAQPCQCPTASDCGGPVA